MTKTTQAEVADLHLNLGLYNSLSYVFYEDETPQVTKERGIEVRLLVIERKPSNPILSKGERNAWVHSYFPKSSSYGMTLLFCFSTSQTRSPGNLIKMQVLGTGNCSLEVECLFSMSEALSLIPKTTKSQARKCRSWDCSLVLTVFA